MRCILFRSGGSQIDVALPVRDNGNPPDWLEVDGIHYKCQGRVDAVTGWIFQEKERVTPPATVTNEVGPKGLAYHINDGVGEDLPASTSSVKYFRGQIAKRDAEIQQLESDVERLRCDKKVANGLIANLEGLAAARLETVAASQDRSIDDYNKSVAREGRLREEIQRINLRLADAEHERVRLRKQLDGQREIAAVENGQLRRALGDAMEKLHMMAATAAPPIVISKSDYGAALRAEIERLSTEVIELTKQRDKAIAAHENAEYGAELLANANEGLTRSLDEMAKSLRAKSEECADRTEALNEVRIDERRSTEEAARFQRKLYEIDQIIKK